MDHRIHIHTNKRKQLLFYASKSFNVTWSATPSFIMVIYHIREKTNNTSTLMLLRTSLWSEM